MRKINALILLQLFIFCPLFSQKNLFTPTTISSKYYNATVKILLIDSLQEAKKPGSGYFGRGSGFFVSDNGLIFTNKHVVEYAMGIINYTYYDKGTRKFYTDKGIYNPSDLNLTFYKINDISRMSIIVQVYDKPSENSYKLYNAKIIALDTGIYDGAVLQIVSDHQGKPVTEKFNHVKIGNSDSTLQGEDLIVYGFPQQYEGNFDLMLRDQSTLNFGQHSGFDFGVDKINGYIKTNASISSGNSGGPVFNNRGEVIGIASAASSKTGNGFIAKINGMYDLAKNDTSVQKQFIESGYVKKENSDKKLSILYDPKPVIPAKEIIDDYNLDQKYLRRFKGGFFYIRGFASVWQDDYMTINPSKDPYITTAGGKLNVKYGRVYQGEVGKIFSIWRINPTNKLSVDWTFFNIKYGTRDWTNSSLFKDSIGSVVDYKKKAEYFGISTKLGFIYSRLINDRYMLDLYYKVGFLYEWSDHMGKYETLYHDSVPFTREIGIYQDPTVTHNIGINFHFHAVTIGLEYCYGKGGLYYEGIKAAPDVYDDYLGITRYNYNNNSDQTGKWALNNLSVHLGVALYNSTRWKWVKK